MEVLAAGAAEGKDRGGEAVEPSSEELHAEAAAAVHSSADRVLRSLKQQEAADGLGLYGEDETAWGSLEPREASRQAAIVAGPVRRGRKAQQGVPGLDGADRVFEHR